MTETRNRGERIRQGYLTRGQVALELGISYKTLTRMTKADASFPRFVSITPGLQVISRADLEAWIAAKFVRERAAAMLGGGEASPVK